MINRLIIRKKFLSKNDFFTFLTRWDLTKDNNTVFYNKYHSQDSWIFKCQIDENIGNFFIGQAGCDNRLLYELKQAGFCFKNPSYSIKSVRTPICRNIEYTITIRIMNLSNRPMSIYFPIRCTRLIHTIILKIFDPKKFEEFKFSFSDYFFYIRFGILPKYESKNENCKKRESFNL